MVGLELKHAHVEVYAIPGAVTHMGLKVVCPQCKTEWGHGDELPSRSDELELSAESHNLDVHGYVPADWREV